MNSFSNEEYDYHFRHEDFPAKDILDPKETNERTFFSWW